MPKLSVYTSKSVSELMDLYEITTVDVTNLHTQIATLSGDLHASYLETYSHSTGKSVAERNRECDFHTRHQYMEIIKLRGELNYKMVLRQMFSDLINWKINQPSVVIPDYMQYPPDSDREEIGHVR